MVVRKFEETHPWITFRADLRGCPPNLWMLLGETRSKCEHLAGTPLKPDVAQQLAAVTLIKGAQATTAIEGNTLTEEQVRGIFEGTYTAPPSRQYQETEVRNMLESLTWLDQAIARGETFTLTSDLICEFHRRVLKGLETDDATPGQIRSHAVGVGRYRAAPAEDVVYLLDRMCEWLEGPDFESDDPELKFAFLVARAVLAHLYLAWIHPFGDGNGRTARLVEFLLLARSGLVPLPAAHLMSNHYNLTRDRYYRELDYASASGGDVTRFVTYAVQGFADGLRESIATVRQQQIGVGWINFVHEVMAQFPTTKASDRQRQLVLAMPIDRVTKRSDLEGLTPRLAALYAQAGPRTLSRDINRLVEVDLIKRVSGGYKPSVHRLLAFLPPVALPADQPLPLE